MAHSKQLSDFQLRGLRKAGDVMIPGDNEFPSFSRSGVMAYADRMLDHMNAGDLAGVRFLFTLFAILPSFLIRAILVVSEQDKVLPGPFGAACRMVNIGVKGIVMTLYYSDFGDLHPSVLERIHWDAQVVEDAAPSQVHQAVASDQPALATVEPNL